MIYLYNTLTRKKEEFKPIQEGVISMYHCGPTVYDRVHIGNLRSFVFADTLRRVFETAGYSVNQVMNITDVDDKTIKKSRDEGVSLSEITTRYEKFFEKDLEKLNVAIKGDTPRATEHVEEMIEMIEELLDKGFAYKSDDGIYFSIEKSENYGELAGVSAGGESKSRIKSDEYDKDNPQDFALWKFHAEEDGDVGWDAPFGKGRPGWHIECSAMSMKYLGKHFDVHTGGVDLVFPHHVNEIAQSQSATGEKFVNYWLHHNHILIDGKKMSKSLGNIYTLSDIEKRGVSPVGYRYWLLTSHYRTLANFTFEAVSGAENAYQKISDFILETPAVGKIDLAYKAEFESFIYDDLDTPKAVALMWELMRDQEIAPADKKATLLYFDKVFGLELSQIKKEEIPEDIKKIAEKREKAREEKNWHLADEIRRSIEDRGYDLKDTENGPKITKRK